MGGVICLSKGKDEEKENGLGQWVKGRGEQVATPACVQFLLKKFFLKKDRKSSWTSL